MNETFRSPSRNEIHRHVHFVVSLAMSALLAAHCVFGCRLHHDHSWCVDTDESHDGVAHQASGCDHDPPATCSTETPDEHRECPLNCDHLALTALANNPLTDLRWQPRAESSDRIREDGLRLSNADAAWTLQNAHGVPPLRAHLLLRVLLF